MKKCLILTAAAVTGVGAALLAPAAIADPRMSVPFTPVLVPLDPPPSRD